MASKKLIVIVGATGNQGFSVAQSFLASNLWRVRCITRNPFSAKAKKLDSLGAEVVEGDLTDKESISRAFNSANAIFANTDFWAIHNDPSINAKAAAAKKTTGRFAFDVEVSYGQVIADAASGVPSLERFVFSALPPVDKSAYTDIANCYHWESKIAILQYIRDQYPRLQEKMSVIYLGAYATNPFIIPRWDERSKSYKIKIPIGSTALLPVVTPDASTGPLTKALIEDEDSGTHLLAYDADSKLTMPQITNIWEKVTGKSITYEHVSAESMHSEFGIPYEILAGAILIERFGYMHGVAHYIEPPQLKNKVATVPYVEWLLSHWQELLPAAGGRAEQ